MDPKARALIFGVIALLVLAALIGSIIYLGQTPKSPSNKNNNSFSNLPVVSAPTPSVVPNPTLPASGRKTYAGQSFLINYPATWGLLTCSNTHNIEFDPATNQDIKGVVCDTAVKPITIVVQDSLNCPGETVKIGNHQVVKSSGPLAGGGTQNNWCLTVGGKVLNITQRVSDKGNQATSSTDYSAQVEDMIKNISNTPQAS